MGSIISLGISRMEIDWGKNGLCNNHSKLFQYSDYGKKMPYYYVGDDDKEIVEYKEGASKKLIEVKERLELLGYDLKNTEKKYNEHVKECESYTSEKLNLTFNEFYNLIYSLDLSKINIVLTSITTYFDEGYDLGEYFRKCIISDNEIKSKMNRIIKKLEKSYYIVGEFFENLDPYIILRILAENPQNIEYNVEWRYNDVIENDWEKIENIIIPLSSKNKILVVTEGKTDSFIIKKTIEGLYPNVSDFFEFIDMEENYPFTGCGNLANFCMGLSKINIQNNVIVLFDNDTSGLELYNKVKDIQKPQNLFVCHLPEQQGFNEIDTIGPSGSNKANINGKAVAIECFLDFLSVDSTPRVRWNNYNKNMKQYQGELENKEEYIRKFKTTNLKSRTYDCSKLKFLVDYIITSWINR